MNSWLVVDWTRTPAFGSYNFDLPCSRSEAFKETISTTERDKRTSMEVNVPNDLSCLALGLLGQ